MTNFLAGLARQRAAFACAAACAAWLAIMASGGAIAAVGGGGETNTTFTTSTTHGDTHTRVDLPDIQASSTRVLGSLNGTIFVYDQTFPNAPSSAQVNGGYTAAAAAISAAGGPAVIIGAPQLVSSSDNRSTPAKTGEQFNHLETSVTTSTTFGPASILIGEDQSQSFFVDPGTLNINTNTHTQNFIDDLFQATTTHSATYQIVGTLQNIGTVHTAILSGALDMAERLLRRLGDEGAGNAMDNVASLGGVHLAQGGIGDGPYRVWAEGYGAWTREDRQGSIPGSSRDSYGFAAGIGTDVAPGLSLGAGLSQGHTRAELNAVFESASLDVTELGLNASYRSGPIVLSAAGTYGIGSVDSRHGNAAMGVSRASYDFTVGGVLAEAGYRVDLIDEWQAVPMIGIGWSAVRNDAFAETGGIALAVPESINGRTRGWVGLALGRRWSGDGMDVGISAYGRLTDTFHGSGRALPTSFVSAPGTPLTIRGFDEGQTGGEVGASLSIALAPMTMLYLAYDGRFGSGFDAHAASGGIAIRW